MKAKIILTTIPEFMTFVHIEDSSPELFNSLLFSFKTRVPRKHRNYSKLTRSWYVPFPGFPHLDRWLASVSVEHPRVSIVRTEIPCPSASAPADSFEHGLRELIGEFKSLLMEVVGK